MKLHSTPIRDVSAKQVYEWIVTKNYSIHRFIQWLEAKKLYRAAECPRYFGHTIIHRADSRLAYERVNSHYWNFRQFQRWLTSNLELS